MAYTTASKIYEKVGITASDLPDGAIDRILEDTDREVDRITKTTSVPKKKIDLFAGNDQNIHFINKIPLLTILKAEIDSTDISLDKIWAQYTGQVELLNGAEKQFFYASVTKPNCFLKYYYGWLEETTTQTDVKTAAEAGSSVTIEVDEADNFTAENWIKIQGFDGNSEVTQIISKDDTNDTLTCDLTRDHEVDSLVTELQVPGIVQNLAGCIGAIMTALYMVGSTYTFATSYSVPDYSVTKGVPYPHFNTNLQAWVKERDFLMSQLPSWPVFE